MVDQRMSKENQDHARALFKRVFNMRSDDPSLCDVTIKMLKSHNYNLDDFVDLNDEEKDMMKKNNADIDKRVEELKNKKKLKELNAMYNKDEKDANNE